MSHEDQKFANGRDKAKRFSETDRGKLIMAKALFIAIGQLSKTEGAFREVGDIADMEFLLTNLYPGHKRMLELGVL